jgi:hypothetical protein
LEGLEAVVSLAVPEEVSFVVVLSEACCPLQAASPSVSANTDIKAVMRLFFIVLRGGNIAVNFLVNFQVSVSKIPLKCSEEGKQKVNKIKNAYFFKEILNIYFCRI